MWSTDGAVLSGMAFFTDFTQTLLFLASTPCKNDSYTWVYGESGLKGMPVFVVVVGDGIWLGSLPGWFCVDLRLAFCYFLSPLEITRFHSHRLRALLGPG